MRSHKVLFLVFGLLGVAFVGCLVWMVQERSERLGESVAKFAAFWQGIGIGVLLMMGLFVLAVGIVGTVRLSWGIEGAVYQLAVRLGRKELKEDLPPPFG